MRRLLLPCLLLLSSLAPARPPAHRAPTPSAQATYCASGNLVNYHRWPTCRGLNRCAATVKPLALSEATSPMDPCKRCN